MSPSIFLQKINAIIAKLDDLSLDMTTSLELQKNKIIGNNSFQFIWKYVKVLHFIKENPTIKDACEFYKKVVYLINGKLRLSKF